MLFPKQPTHCVRRARARAQQLSVSLRPTQRTLPASCFQANGFRRFPADKFFTEMARCIEMMRWNRATSLNLQRLCNLPLNLRPLALRCSDNGKP
jgi:hypothetical protein